MLKNLLKPAMLFLPFLLGLAFPEAHILGKAPYHLVRWALIVMVFLAALQLQFRDMRFRKEHFKSLILNFAMALLPYTFVRIFFPEEKLLAEILFFTGITPTATAAPVVTGLLNARIGFALTGFVLSNVAIALSLFLLLPFVTGNYSFSFLLNVAWTLLLVVAFPMGTAILARKCFPALPAFVKKRKLASLFLWSFCLFIMAATAGEYFRKQEKSALLMVLLAGGLTLVICFCNFFFGRIIARKKYARETSQISGQKNTTFSMYLALAYASSPAAALGPIFYILWHNLWNAYQIWRYEARRGKREKISPR